MMLISEFPEQHYNILNHITQVCLYIGPMPIEAIPFSLGRVWLAMQPHLYKPIDFWIRSLPNHEVSFWVSQELGPSKHFSLAVRARTPP